MKKYKDLCDYDFSDYAEEITGDALFKINGGAEVENSHEGVANAQVGDTITRNDGTVVTLNQADIDYAQQQLGTYGNPDQNDTSTGTQNYSGGSNQTVNSTNTTNEEKKSLMYDPHNPSRVIVDLDDPKAMQQAADLLADPSLGLRITAYGSESGITKNFKDYGEIIKYLGADRPRTFFRWII
ncbi:MAG: hypothetical protein MJ160_02160 [Treponema sp.]|nr:hypothetical protein [Treponema sp.]